VAADLFELEGKTYLVTSDYYSDFFELDHLRSPLSVCVIRKLKAHFARHGIPEQLATDNGSQFTSRDFLKFAKDWDFEHLTSSPHHSQGNGKAESAVKKLRKSSESASPVDRMLFYPYSITITPDLPVSKLIQHRASSTEGLEVYYR